MRAVTVYTIADLRPDFISWQHRCLERFALDPYRLVVVNNGSTPERVEAIETTCRQLGVESVTGPGPVDPHASIVCAAAMQFIQDELIARQTGLAAIFDSDLFLLRPFSIRAYLGDFDFAAVRKQDGHVDYPWNGIVLQNPATLPDRAGMDWSCGRIEGQHVDTGGCLHLWMRRNPSLRFRAVEWTYDLCASANNLHLLPARLRARYVDAFGLQFCAKAFLHYCRGSNWDGMSPEHHAAKTALVEEILRGCLEGDLAMTADGALVAPRRRPGDHSTYP